MGFGEWVDCTKSQVWRQETARPCSQWKEYITTLGETKRCSSTKTEGGLQRSWKMLDFHFVLFVLFGRRQERDLFQGPKYEAGTNRQGRWMREDIQDKTILCPDLDEILNKVPNTVLTCTSTSKFKFTWR